MELGLTVGDSLERIEQFGGNYDFVELGLGESVQLEETFDPAIITSLLGEVNCDLCIHLPFKQDLVTPVPEINDGIVKFLTRLLEWGSNAGAHTAVVHGTARNPSETALRPVFVEQLQELNERAAERGIELVVENVGHQPRGVPLSVLIDLAEEAGTAICADIGHAYMENRADGVKHLLSKAGDRISHVHMHDVRRRGDTHLPLGAGEIDFTVVQQRLEGFDGTAAIEVFSDDADLLADTTTRTRRILTTNTQ